MSWGHTIPKEKKWPVKGTIVILSHDPGYRDITYPEKELTHQQLLKRIDYEKRRKISRGFTDQNGSERT